MALDPVSALLDIGGKVMDRLWPDPVQAAAAKMELFKLQQSGELSIIAGQLDINKAEAANPSIFVSGWRPGIGWVCGAGFAVQFVIGPLAEWGSALYGHPVKFPQMDMGTMMPLMLGMLGLSGMRTAEKINGVAAKMNLFIPILYICMNGSCAFLQQITVYANEDECEQVVAEKKTWYLANTKATVDTTCIYAPAKVLENDVKPKRKETV